MESLEKLSNKTLYTILITVISILSFILCGIVLLLASRVSDLFISPPTSTPNLALAVETLISESWTQTAESVQVILNTPVPLPPEIAPPTEHPEPMEKNGLTITPAVGPPVSADIGVWTSIGPWISVYTLAIDPVTSTTLYAGTDKGVFKSTDNGANWSVFGADLFETPINSLAVVPDNPATIYAGGLGMFKSTDFGESWYSINSGLTDTVVTSIAIDSVTPTTLYIGTTDGVFKSSNSGLDWASVTLNLDVPIITSLVINPDTPTTIYAQTQVHGIFKSVDGGNSWSTITPDSIAYNSLAMDPSAPNILYLGGDDLAKSLDSGENWITVNNDENLRFDTLVINPITPNVFYTFSNPGNVYRTTNGGSNWTLINTGLPETYIYRLIIDPQKSETLYLGTEDGVFQSEDNGASWRQISNGLSKSKILDLAIDPSTPNIIYANTLYDGLLKSTNRGATWQRINYNFPGQFITAFAIDPLVSSNLYAGVVANGVFRSTDGGKNWREVSTGLTIRTISALAIDPISPTTLYAGTASDGSVFKSINSGDTWSKLNTGLTDTTIDFLVIDPHTPTTIYMGTQSKGVFKSIDGGQNWSESNHGLPDGLITDLIIDPQTPEILYAGTYEGVFKTIDGGQNWRTVNVGLTKRRIGSLAIDPLTPTTLFAGVVFDDGMFKSIDGGNNWVELNTGLTEVTAVAIDPISPSIIYAVSNESILTNRDDRIFTRIPEPTPTVSPPISPEDLSQEFPFKISGQLEFRKQSQIPENAQVVVIWSVSVAGSDAGYVFGEGTIDIEQNYFEVVFNGPPPSEALYWNGSSAIGIGILFLVDYQELEPGILDSDQFFEKEVYGASGQYQIIFIYGDIELPEDEHWILQFDQGFNAGKGVHIPDESFEGFVPIAPTEMLIIIDDFENIEFVNWQ